MAVLLGLDAKLYYYDPTSVVDRPSPTAGEIAKALITSDFLELSNVTDVTVNLSKAEADITTRGAGGFRAKVGTLKEGELSFEMIWDTNDASFLAVSDAYFGNTALTFLALDQNAQNAADGPPVIAPQGIYADFSVLNFEKSEALEDAQRVSVTISVTTGGPLSLLSPAVQPSWVVITES